MVKKLKMKWKQHGNRDDIGCYKEQGSPKSGIPFSGSLLDCGSKQFGVFIGPPISESYQISSTTQGQGYPLKRSSFQSA